MKCYLVIGNDTLDEAEECDSIGEAKRSYMRAAEELIQYGQQIDGAIHFADSHEEIVEYPDRVLSLGPREGLRYERT